MCANSTHETSGDERMDGEPLSGIQVHSGSPTTIAASHGRRVGLRGIRQVMQGGDDTIATVHLTHGARCALDEHDASLPPPSARLLALAWLHSHVSSR